MLAAVIRIAIAFIHLLFFLFARAAGPLQKKVEKVLIATVDAAGRLNRAGCLFRTGSSL
jgi:hypothetical protein